jgi:hypothetical protein
MPRSRRLIHPGTCLSSLQLPMLSDATMRRPASENSQDGAKQHRVEDGQAQPVLQQRTNSAIA